jgi:fatty-acyl-CoA synthase
VAHPKWQERPLLVVMLKEGASLDARTLLEFLAPKVARWWLPDAVEFVDALPMTATGKIHKPTLRARYRGLPASRTLIGDAARRTDPWTLPGRNREIRTPDA